MTKKPVLAGLLPQEIGVIIRNTTGLDLPAFRSAQICQWIKKAAAFDQMLNLPLALREDLAKNLRLYSSSVTGDFTDSDGTVKLRLGLEDGCSIEAVILNDGKDRKTACLSAQAGCPLSCVFCKTGTLGFKRNLTAAEITEQFIFLRQKCPDISHIVIMGMGEPLFNLDELRKAINYFTDVNGFGISKRRITVSTAGICAGIADLADNGPDVRLAVSLTSARQELREKLMPAAKANPLPSLKNSLVYYQNKNKRRITLETVLLKEINTGVKDAAAIAEFAESLDTVINLIPWNPVDGLLLDGRPLQPPSADETAAFAGALAKLNLKVTMRLSKGKGVCGACGQLGSL
ncbi:MAG: 23S rRNA (adenine(2503)-C(2))-methyltransferase RlmN [Treponema sp.]|nr:23S rRNA (adenine(2503)-C(2))-methyltransferase RlmN [Treponema sp.]